MKRMPRPLVVALAAVSASLLGLAAGAVWMLPIVWFQARLPMLAIPVGVLLGWAVARAVAPRRGTAWWSAWATLLACLYVDVLVAGAGLAGSLGIGLIEAVRQAGPAMLWALMRLSFSPGHWLWYAAGVATAAWVGRRCSARQGVPPPPDARASRE